MPINKEILDLKNMIINAHKNIDSVLQSNHKN